MSFKIYGYEGNPRTNIILAVAKAEGIDYELVKTLPYEKEDAYLTKFPLAEGRIPALEGPNIQLTECIAISSYLAGLNNKAKLLGTSKEAAAEILQWASFANSQIMTPLTEWYRPLLPDSAVPYHEHLVRTAEHKVTKTLHVLENHLLTRTYLVGHRLSLADLFVALMIGRGLEYVFDAKWREKHRSIVRYYNTVSRQSCVSAVVPHPTLCEERLKHVHAPKQPKKAEQAPKKTEPAAKKAVKKDDDDDDEPSAPAEAKPKHPCEALGPAKSFPLDQWKRTYSNDPLPKALEWLSANLDESEYTFWRVSYKYDSELSQIFMSANLLSGFHNRLEASRKYLFGSVGVYGKANDSKIQGAYMLRGTDWKPVFEVAPDWESYNFEKLDFKKDIGYITGCWARDNTYDGHEYADGKVFK